MGKYEDAMEIAVAAKNFLEELNKYRNRSFDQNQNSTDHQIACVEDLEDVLMAVVMKNQHVFLPDDGDDIDVDIDENAGC